ncbi:MAG: glutaredoxin 3 [Beijerinckiaceae bacterium]|nr:glutaredoxin 3 [Beijerinckiaceae bacterium]
MQEVVIYTTMYCPFCERAKALLSAKNVAFREVAVDGDRALRQAMAELAGGRSSVPQIFFGTRHIGGCDDLVALEREGVLDSLLHELAG